jgi:hypothetical protein
VKIFAADGLSAFEKPQPGFRARHLERPAPWRCPEATVAVNGVSFLNQDCAHLPQQMVFKIRAGDLDLFDRRRTRRQSRQRLDSQIHCRYILPAISVNKLGNFGVRWHSEAATALWIAFSRTEASNLRPQYPMRRRRFALPAHSKKEDLCQES